MKNSNIKKVFIAGHKGMVGSAITKKLEKDPSVAIIVEPKSNLNLLNQSQVTKFFESNEIDEVFIAAAKVGGINANQSFPADFIYQNLMIQANIINSAHIADVKKLLFLGSSCIYPANADQPMKESALLSGPLEKTNQPYALAKISGLELCHSFNTQFGTDFRGLMPSNLYGENDNFNLKNSHVIPALISKFHDAVASNHKQIKVWGTGKPKREFLHVDDLAEACIFVMSLDKEKFLEGINHNHCYLNVGSGEEVSISDVAIALKNISGFDGEIIYDNSMPDGTKRKLLDSTAIKNLGWKSTISLEDGLKKTYDWFSIHNSTIHGIKE